MSLLSRDILAAIAPDQHHTMSTVRQSDIQRLTSKTARWELDMVEFAIQYVVQS
jgi:hypothetical protein